MSKLKMLPLSEYVGVNRDDPIRFYALPVIGQLYRRRVEYCLAELNPSSRILEIGFGSGVTFFNLQTMYSEIYGVDLTASVEDVTNFFQEHGVETKLKNGNINNLPYSDNSFDSVLAISILEHLKPEALGIAIQEVERVLKVGGQFVYGVPVDHPIMTFMFRLLGYNIREHHFSTEKDISAAASHILSRKQIVKMSGPWGIPKNIYEVGHFTKIAA